MVSRLRSKSPPSRALRTPRLCLTIAVLLWPSLQACAEENTSLSSRDIWAAGELWTDDLSLVAVGEDGAVPRQLFSFNLPSLHLDNLVHEASNFITSAKQKVQGAFQGMSDMVNLFKSSKEWLRKGLEVAQVAWSSIRQLAKRLRNIFTEFAPLKPVFEDKSGLMKLVTSPNLMRTLMSVISRLLDTSSVFKSLAGALGSISDIFQQVSDVFHTALGKLGVGRLLAANQTQESWQDLLQGINFSEIVQRFRTFVTQATKHAGDLDSVRVVLQPVLDTMLGRPSVHNATTPLTTIAPPAPAPRVAPTVLVTDTPRPASLPAVEAEVSTTTTGLLPPPATPSPAAQVPPLRRLNILTDQKRYEEAVKKIVPTWQAIEQLGLQMCPKIVHARDTAMSLKCRVEGFISDVPGLSQLAGLRSECGSAQPEGSRAEAHAACPAQSLAAGIKDLLGKNASSIGLVLAVLASIGCFGAACAGGVGAVATAAGVFNQQGGDDGGDESDEEAAGFAEGPDE